MNKYFDKIYVINLQEDIDRREFIIKQFENFKLLINLL